MQIGEFPFCPHPVAATAVAGDDIPGGYEVKHGICWPDGTPRKFYSKSAIRKAAYEAGYIVGDDTPKPNPRIVEQREREKSSKVRSSHENR